MHKGCVSPTPAASNRPSASDSRVWSHILTGEYTSIFALDRCYNLAQSSCKLEITNILWTGLGYGSRGVSGQHLQHGKNPSASTVRLAFRLLFSHLNVVPFETCVHTFHLTAMYKVETRGKSRVWSPYNL